VTHEHHNVTIVYIQKKTNKIFQQISSLHNIILIAKPRTDSLLLDIHDLKSNDKYDAQPNVKHHHGTTLNTGTEHNFDGNKSQRYVGNIGYKYTIIS
jgi:hypothetical protein